jgi:hypothetical protein
MGIWTMVPLDPFIHCTVAQLECPFTCYEVDNDPIKKAVRMILPGVFRLLLFQTLLHWHKWRRTRYFGPNGGTCGQNPGDVGLLDGRLQRCEGCRRVPRWAGRNRRRESPALPRNGDVLFEGGEGQAIFVCDV